MSLDLNPSHEYFIDESLEILAETQDSLRRFKPTHPSSDLVSQVFRAIHSIKGTAATLGIEDIAAITHHAENILDHIRTIWTYTRELNDAHIGALRRSLDEISAHFDIYRLGRLPSQAQTNQAILRLEALFVELKRQDGEKAQAHLIPLAQPNVAQLEHRYRIELSNASQTNIQHITESLTALGTLKHAGKHASKAYCLELQTTETRETIELICAFYLSPKDIAITSPSSTQSSGSPSAHEPDLTEQSASESDMQFGRSIRVAHGQLIDLKTLIDDLTELKQKIALDQSRLSHAWNVSLLESNIYQLRQLLDRMRNLSLDHLFAKFQTLTDTLSARLDKKVRLHITGASVVTDKFVIEQLNVPLIQLLRNSIDHGIEPPDVRRHRNKSECGNIFICAKHEHNQLILELSDDGAGLDRTAVLAAALSKNIPVSDITKDQDIWSLIFAAGLTTAQSVTDISGRGFGLNIVKQRIDSLGGMITIDSTLGRGTKFVISIPVHSLNDNDQTAGSREMHC
jgi:two-component system chemotaxis sensor kinase CheA